MLLKLREALLGAAFALLVMTTAAVPFTRVTNAQDSMPVSVEQVRIAALESVMAPAQIKLSDHEGRIIRLEDAVNVIRDSAEESRWWARGIGIALALAVVERVLRTAGIIGTIGKSDGLGPVG